MNYHPRYFQLYELVPPDIFDERGQAAWELFDPRLLAILDRLRSFFGPIIINDWYWGGAYTESGLRSFESSTGTRYSQHRYGRAADLKFRSEEPQEVHRRILANPEDFPGLTTLEDISATISWVHVDVRNNLQSGIRIVRP